MGFNGEHFPGEGVGQVDLFGAEPLVGVAELERIFLAFHRAVLGVAQDGGAQVGAVEPKLVGQQLGLDPLLTLFFLYVGYRLWGLFGMILAPLLTGMTLQLTARYPGQN